MDYENILFVQHSVFTGSKSVFYSAPKDPKHTYPTLPYDLFYDPTDLSYSGPPYPGYLDESVDIEKRVDYLNKIIGKAKNEISNCAKPTAPADKWPADWDKKTLVVFVTPEFYFRPKRGAYTLDSVKKLKDKLRDLVNKEAYENWLFVFGTIIGKSGNFLFQTIENQAYILGVLRDHDKVKIKFIKKYKKKHRSDIDYVREKGSYQGPPPLKLITLQNVADISKKAEPGIFSFNNIEFGIEICLDHSVGVLRGHLTSPTPQKRPHVHIITSSGMNVKPEKVVALPKGYVFLCDGGRRYHLHNFDGYRRVESNYTANGRVHFETIPLTVPLAIYKSPLRDDIPDGTTFFIHTTDYPVLSIFKAENVHNIPSENWA